jgi:hypothetical protein
LIVLAVALLVGSAAAFTRSERLKLAASPVGKPKFDRRLSPSCGCAHAASSLSFLLRRPERLDATVVDSDGGHVATLADAQESEAGTVSFEWDGRDDEGQVVPDGRYRLKVRLERDRRTILIPKTILVDTAPPDVSIVKAVMTDDVVLLRYRTSEGMRARVLLDGEPVGRDNRSKAGLGRVTWTSPEGAPTGGLTLLAVDRSGNRSEPVPFSVATP